MVNQQTPFIARAQEMSHCLSMLEGPANCSKLIVISAPLGGGKTRFLEELRRQAANKFSGQYHIFEPIDALDPLIQSRNGFFEKIYETLRSDDKVRLNLVEQYEAYLKRQLAGDFFRRSWHTQEFETEMQRLFEPANRLPLVILIDNAEVWLAPHTEVGYDCINCDHTFTWLLQKAYEFPITLVMCYQQESQEAPQKQIKDSITLRIRQIQEDLPDPSFTFLSPFSEENTLQFFVESQLYFQDKYERLSKRIDLLSNANKRMAHYLTGGNPFLLHLIIESLSFGNAFELPPQMMQDPRWFQNIKAEGVKQRVKDEFIASLMNRFLKDYFFGDVLRALARAPRGVDDELLERLLYQSLSDLPKKSYDQMYDRKRNENAHYSWKRAARNINSQKETIAEASFMENQKSGFLRLHGFMISLIRQYAFRDKGDTREAYVKGNVIDHYYSDRLVEVQESLNQLFSVPELEGRPIFHNADRAFRLMRQRKSLLAERLYYQFQYSPVTGFRYYIRYQQEAVLLHDPVLFEALDFEIYRLCFQQMCIKAGKEENEVVGRLLRGELQLHSHKSAYVYRCFNRQMTKNQQTDTKQQSGLHSFNAAVWEILCQLADPDNHLNQEKMKEEWVEKLDEIAGELNKKKKDKKSEQNLVGLNERYSPNLLEHWWYPNVVLGFCYSTRAFLHRLRGEMVDAATYYSYAANYFRIINSKVYQALVLNALGHVKSAMGQWQDAFVVIRDAYTLRRELASRAPVATSLLGVGRNRVMEGAYETAVVYFERAQALFEVLDDQQGWLMTCVMNGEAKRRSVTAGDSTEMKEQEALLFTAIQNIQKVLNLSQNNVESHKEARANAFIELGCIYRDWIYLKWKNGEDLPEIEPLYQKGTGYLEDALRLLGTKEQVKGEGHQQKYLWVDATVTQLLLDYNRNLTLERGWKDGFYQTLQNIREKACRVWEEIHYLQGKELSYLGSVLLEKGDNPYPRLWTQLAKLEILIGHIVWRQAMRRIDEIMNGGVNMGAALIDPIVKDLVNQAVAAYANGLQYGNYYSTNYLGLQLLTDQIYDFLKIQRFEILQMVAKAVIVYAHLEKNKIVLNELKRQKEPFALKDFLKNRLLWVEEERKR